MGSNTVPLVGAEALRNYSMVAINRNFYFVVLLLLISSHAALSLHIATHVTTDGTICQLCTNGSNPVIAITHSVAPQPAPLTQYTLKYNPVTLGSSRKDFSPGHPRAPPEFV